MSKFATKAAANMFCQARYEAAKSNERLSSREGAAEEIGIDRTRLARIELGSTIPYQEEVLLMADCYKAPELKGNYCREMCPLGKNMPKIENAGLDRISLRMLSSLKKINEAIRRIIRDCNDEQFLHSDEPDVLLSHFSCHSLRHTFTTRMCEAGVNIKVIQDALGHSDISTTLNIYADVTKEMKAEEFKGLDSYFKV